MRCEFTIRTNNFGHALCMVFCVFIALPIQQIHAETIRLFAQAPTNHIEQQQHAALCSRHVQSTIDQLKKPKEEDHESFRRDVISALDALSLCLQQNVEAMEQRNKAQVGAPSKVSEL